MTNEIEDMMQTATDNGKDYLSFDLENAYYQDCLTEESEYSVNIDEFLIDCYLEKEYTTIILSHFDKEGFRILQNYNSVGSNHKLAQIVFVWR